MSKRILATIMLIALLVTQLFVPVVFAGKSDVKQAIDQLYDLGPEAKGTLLKSMWSYGIENIARIDDISEDEIYEQIVQSLTDIEQAEIIGEGKGKVSEEAVRIVIRELMANKEIIKDIYDEYETYIDATIVKLALGLEASASRGDVVIALTDPNNSVPILTSNEEDTGFARNNDVAEGFARILSRNLGADQLQELIAIVLSDMNSKVDSLAKRINDKIGYQNITKENIIYVLNLYNLYESNPAYPEVVSSSPANNATGVKVGSTIKITYDMNIYKGYDNKINTITLSSGQTNVEIDTSIQGKTLTITPKSSLSYSTKYTLTIPEGAVASEVMRPASPVTISFTTESSGGPVIPPPTGDDDTTPTTPQEPELEEDDKEQKEIVAEIETIIEGIKEEDIFSATEDELTNIADDVSKKLADAALLVNSVKDPEVAVDMAKTLIEKTGTLAVKLAVTNNTSAYDALAKDVKQLANSVILNVGSLEIDTEAITSDDGKVTAQIKLGEAEAGKLIDKATEEKLDLIVSTAQQLNQTARDAGIEEDVVAPVLFINVATGVESSAANVEVPSNLVLALNESGIEGMILVTDVATFTVPSDAISVEANTNIKFNCDKLDSSALSNEVKELVQDAPVFDLYITINDVRVSNYNNLIGVSVPYTLKLGEDPEKITVFYINEEGQLENVIGKYDAETGSVYFETDHFSQYTVKVNNVTFDDVDSKFWAANYIEVMASKGVIKGIGDGSKFAPNNNVTRAEFAAMIVREFKLFDKTAVNNFKDVSEKDWFYPEVTAAAKLGIVQGRPGGIFAPNDKITREEMAKMLSNALTLVLKKKVPANKDTLLASFTDSEQIADYAKDAVAMGVRYGIFSGRPDGTFAPKDTANRAEASKLIYMLFYLD